MLFRILGKILQDRIICYAHRILQGNDKKKKRNILFQVQISELCHYLFLFYSVSPQFRNNSHIFIFITFIKICKRESNLFYYW